VPYLYRTNFIEFFIPHLLVSMAELTCEGCGSKFKGRGYTAHLSRTTNPPCMAIFERESARGLADQALSEDFGKPQDHGLPHGQFMGDFFGEYGPREFDYIESDDEGEISSGGSEEEEDEEEDLDAGERADLADGYEAPRPAVHDDVSMAGPDSVAVPDNHPALVRVREVRKAAEDRFHHQPVVVKYPGGLAGRQISPAIHPTSEKAYESTLEGSAPSNPYAPFTSKMDWEVAKWAKLRGAGSTAFSDLLNIEGVSEMTARTRKFSA
jgi:hypothetical protein